MATIFKGQSKWLWLSVIVIILDQVSKYIAISYLQPYQPVPFFRGFNWMLAFNRGAAFSFLDSAGGWQLWLFNALAFLISIVLVVWMTKMKPQEKRLAIAFSLIVGGAIGNVIDRILYAQVTDFIDWYYGAYHWPTFNLADSFIFLGAAIFIFDSWMQNSESNNTDSLKND